MIIAIDGPAASGKGTLGKKLAAHYRFRHLDTGLLYRAVAKALLDSGHEPGDEARAIAAAKAIDPAGFDEAALKRHEVGEAASVVSAIPGVRAALFNFQQEFAAAPPRPRFAPAAAPWNCGGAARASTRPTSWLTSSAATSATAHAPPRRWFRLRTPICSIPAR